MPACAPRVLTACVPQAGTPSPSKAAFRCTLSKTTLALPACSAAAHSSRRATGGNGGLALVHQQLRDRHAVHLDGRRRGALRRRAPWAQPGQLRPHLLQHQRPSEPRQVVSVHQRHGRIGQPGGGGADRGGRHVAGRRGIHRKRRVVLQARALPGRPRLFQLARAGAAMHGLSPSFDA